MRSRTGGKILLMVAGSLLFAGGWLLGQQTAKTEKALLHAFAYTALEGATQKDFDDFRMATGDMVGKIPGLRKVWVGKLRRPLRQGDEQRTHGVAMEFDDEKALEVYADHPAHTEWVKVYEKVRVPGTTTFDILGE